MAEEMFKTTLMGGFDKDDVQEKVQKMKDETAQQQLAFKKEIEEKEQRIAELQKRLELKEANQERLEREIQEKYQKYDHEDHCDRCNYNILSSLQWGT